MEGDHLRSGMEEGSWGGARGGGEGFGRLMVSGWPWAPGAVERLGILNDRQDVRTSGDGVDDVQGYWLVLPHQAMVSVSNVKRCSYRLYSSGSGGESGGGSGSSSSSSGGEDSEEGSSLRTEDKSMPDVTKLETGRGRARERRLEG